MKSDEGGFAAVELVLLTPLLVLLVLFVILLGRYQAARAEVASSARDAARAASLAYDPAVATTQAEAAARASFASSGLACASSSVSVDTAALRPAGRVSVAVRCTLALSDLGLGLPGSRTFAASFVEPVDTYRTSNG